MSGLRSGLELDDQSVPLSVFYNFDDSWSGFINYFSLYDNNKAAETAGAVAGLSNNFTFLAGQSSVGGCHH